MDTSKTNTGIIKQSKFQVFCSPGTPEGHSDQMEDPPSRGKRRSEKLYRSDSHQLLQG